MIVLARHEAVLIGGSAGSLEPLKEIVSALPADFGASVFIAQHISPKAEPTLARHLQRHCKLPIKYPMDEEDYLPSAIYVAPPGNHMLLTYRKVWVFPANFVYLPKPNIDLMLQSAANEFTGRAIGIILSGTGSDGAIGLKAIKEKGGTTIVQNPASAEFDGMPNEAIATGAVEHVLSPEVIPSTIIRLVKGNQEETIEAEEHIDSPTTASRLQR